MLADDGGHFLGADGEVLGTARERGFAKFGQHRDGIVAGPLHEQPRGLLADRVPLGRGALAQPLLERPSLAHRQLDHRRRRYCVEQPVRLAIALAHQRFVSEQQQAGRRRRTRDVLTQRVGAFDSEGLTVADDNEPGAHAERQRERRTYDRLGGRLTGVEDLAAQRGEPRVREEDPCHGGESVVERLPVRPVNERQRRHLSRLDLARERGDVR